MIWRYLALPLACGLAALTSVAVPARADGPLPVIYDSAPAIVQFALNHDGPPPGANDFGCEPSADHPYPVILVPATATTMSLDFNALSPLLKNNGYCVFALNYGRYGLLTADGEISASAAELSTFVDEVLARTGAAEVDLVGHSQGGGPMPRYYLKYLGGAAKVHRLVGLAPPNHGGTIMGTTVIFQVFPWLTDPLDVTLGPAWAEQFGGSAFLADLNAGGDTVPGVSYTVIQTRYDEIGTPYAGAFLAGPDVVNITLQDECALDLSEHLSIAFDHIALGEVLNALDPAHATTPVCGPVLPIVGG
jgi:triacylglycerol esterase/lipase EstA (alpha/beta hydrolase family)